MQAFGLSGCHVTNLFDLSNFLELFPEKIPNDDLFMTWMNLDELGQGSDFGQKWFDFDKMTA